MKRKVLAALCVTAISAGLLAGCGSSDKAEDTAKTEETTTEETSDQEEASTDSSSDSSEAVSEEEGKEAGFSDGSETDSSDAENEDADSSDSENTDSNTADSEDESAGVLLDTSEELTGTHHAEIEVKDYGTIEVELDADTAPITVTNFVKLAQEGFYDGLTFHRIMDGFMIQGGDTNGNGTGGSDENIKGEFSSNGVENDISHTRGTISMARASDPDSGSSQFFIVQSDSTFLDGDYAGFGHVTNGMDIVDQICKDSNPTDNNGTIPADEQPVIETVKITD